MKRLSTFLITTSLCFFSTLNLQAQDIGFSDNSEPKKKLYLTTGIDGYLLSSSSLKTPNQTAALTTPRFTMFLHIGGLAHYDFTNNVGMFLGLGLKNLGFIEKYNDSDLTTIRRTYNIGIPLALKFGNLRGNGTYFMVGGGVDFPIHFKEKTFTKRSSKTKEGEWFSNRTEQVMPYVFVGARFKPGVTIKAQYYTGNFMNTDFVGSSTLPNSVSNGKPYAGYEVHTFLLSLGVDLRMKAKY